MVFAALDAAAVRYLVAGGVAVNGYGLLRLAKDLDLVVQLVPENLRQALEALHEISRRFKIPIPIEQASDPDNLRRWQVEKHVRVMQLYEGARLEQLRRWAALPFREKMEALEEMCDMAFFVLESRKRRGLPYIDPFTNELVPGTSVGREDASREE